MTDPVRLATAGSHHYTIERELGARGMTVVDLAKDAKPEAFMRGVVRGTH